MAAASAALTNLAVITPTLEIQISDPRRHALFANDVANNVANDAANRAMPARAPGDWRSVRYPGGIPEPGFVACA
jgi:xanthine/CO dehydrogenase XdhC/CoxF family maturation factor